MKVWKKVHLKEQDKNINILSNTITNYLYTNGPLEQLCMKYHVNHQEIKKYIANRIAGILVIYIANDQRRIHDIVNRYYTKETFLSHIVPELEGYIDQ